MDSRALLEDIIKDLSADNLIRFFRDKSRAFAPKQESLAHYNDEYFKEGLKLGEISFSDGQKLIVCAFKAGQELTERSGKKAQYDKAKKILKEMQVFSVGIFVFYDKNGSFRFSLVYPESMGTRRQWSNFRRFTYYVSKELTNKTFIQRVGSGDFSSIDNIKDAFSVDKVTNKFFEEFREVFEKTKQEFEKSNKNTACLWLKDRYSDEDYKEQLNKFTFTFLGRIIFLYFLLRKGWIENKKDYIRKIVEDKSISTLYINIFQPLFFDVFAKKESERPAEIKKQYADTPYLNGGLFERSDLESSMEKVGIMILFSDLFIRNIILNYFEAYNFTIDENSPDDQEVSIDPEMLGKVFENTLAEEEMEKKGTFYTPREVVHFMVKEALWQFLKNETDINPDLLKGLVYDEEFDMTKLAKDQIRLIDSRLEGVKVLDPAVGSAAFPVEMMQVLVKIRKKLNVTVGKNINEVSLKKQFIKNNLYGVDIDPGAIEIAKLRLWLALIVDYEKSEAEPLPNLDFQFRVGNSLQEKIDDLDIFNEEAAEQQGLFKSASEYDKMKHKMIEIKDKFYVSTNESEKKKLKRAFDELEHGLMRAVLDKYRDEIKSQQKNRDFVKVAKLLKGTLNKMDRLEQKIKDGTYKLFKPDFHFSEVFDRKDKDRNKINGFDIVIGNPPYGVKVEDNIKEWHGLGSKDSYGVFVSTAIKRFLKSGGILSYIVSDTWLTIKTHKPLREQVLSKQLHKIVRLHQDCFDATVNACVMLLTNSPDNNGDLIAADLTNISTRKEIEELRKILYNLESYSGQFNATYAVYEYNQDLIKTNSNMPIFVGSPKLFVLTNDNNSVSTKEYGINLKYTTKLNGVDLELFRLGDEYSGSGGSRSWQNIGLVRIISGIKTGGNEKYVYKAANGRGSYKIVNKAFILSNNEIRKLSEDEINNGINPANHNGRYMVPLDKGGESDSAEGWMPNYNVPTEYFIDWRIKAVKDMAKEPHSDLANAEFRFKQGLTYSRTGIYAPTFRIGSGGILESKGCGLFSETMDLCLMLGILNTKLLKYIIKNYIMHSVESSVGLLPSTMILIPNIKTSQRIVELVRTIIKRQIKDPRYDYASHEQKEIDKLVYDMYGLNADDIREVETWYARRYPKLARFCEV